MGQAKARGSYEQRKAEAIKAREEREAQECKLRRELGQRRGKSRANMALAVALAVGLNQHSGHAA